MKKNFPVTESHKHCFNFFPKEYHCCFTKDVETIKNLSNVIIYLLLTNGTYCWYYTENVRDDTLYGYKMNGDRWIYMPVNLRKIHSYY